MDPERLELINVMSHAHTVIPFNIIKAACIQGVNGAGKSVIPDAILLACFGECSRGKGGDMIRLGETEMTIIYDLKQSGHLYRILRKWSSAGRGKTAVELSMHNGGTPPFDWEPIATGEEAKKKILDLIKRDYESMTSSSFLLQGQGEKLINSKATERYKVVFDILGLNKYEDLRTKAVKKKNTCIGQKDTLLTVIDELRVKAGKLNEIAANKERVEEELAEIRKGLSEKETVFSVKSSEVAVLRSRLKDMESIKVEMTRFETERSGLNAQLESLTKSLKTLPSDMEEIVLRLVGKMTMEEALSKSAVISALIEGLKKLDAEISSLASRRVTLTSRRQEVENLLSAQKKILDNKDRILQLVSEETAKTEEMAALKTEQESLEREIETITSNLRRGSELGTEIAKIEGVIAIKEKERESALKASKSDLESARTEAELLPHTVCKGEGEYASCPLIEKAVESKRLIPCLEAKVEAFLRPLETEEKGTLDRLLKEREGFGMKSLEKALSDGKERIAGMKDSVKILESRLATIRTWTEKASVMNSAEGEVKRLEERAVEIDRDMADIDVKVKDLSAQKSQAASLSRELAVFQMVVERLRVESESKELKRRMETVDTAISEVRKKLEDCYSMEKRLSVLQVEIDALKSEIDSLKEKEKRTFSEMMRFETEIKNCLRNEEEAKTKETEAGNLSVKIKVFEFLEEAYEKIPFLILDNVIEIMEEEANKVLEEISTAGMRIELRTEKLNKNGKGAKDALDIIVSDIAGERRIELYSGGEKTRQILALAVGLAELSARKAGVKIETLLIDEPAGLDAQGLTDFGRCFIQLVESGMFKKGLLMAHEEVLKDIFEQKILVSKNGTTSHVEVFA